MWKSVSLALTPLHFLWFQSNGNGPKRVPVSQTAVVTPSPHQHSLGLSNGPQRIQRPASHQKPVTHVSVAVKSTPYADQNVNPDTPTVQPKYASQQNVPKKNEAAVNPEPAKPPSQSARPENPQSKPYRELGKMNTVSVLNTQFLYFSFFWLGKPAKKDSDNSASKYV